MGSALPSVVPERRVAWVTGAAGALGATLGAALVAAGWRVVATGREPGPVDGPARLSWVSADLTRDRPWDALAAAGAGAVPDVVFHCAGPGSVGAAAAQPLDALAVTVTATAGLCEWLRARAPGARLVAASSAAVHGAQPAPWRESDPPAPVSVYGWHKLMMENQLALARGQGVETVAVRFFSLYGPGLRKQVLWDSWRRAGEGALEMAGTGAERRDFLYLEDAARLLVLLGTLPPGAVPPVVNGGSGRAISMAELMALWLPLVAPGMGLRFTGAVRPGDPPATLADTTLAEALGFRPAWTLEAGLRETAAAFTRG
jgi:UDP-glucose 4-epimerase